MYEMLIVAILCLTLGIEQMKLHGNSSRKEYDLKSGEETINATSKSENDVHTRNSLTDVSTTQAQNANREISTSKDNLIRESTSIGFDADESLNWTQVLGCYKNKSPVDVDITTNNHIIECNIKCKRLSKQQHKYLGLQDNTCYCFENKPPASTYGCAAKGCEGSREFCGKGENETVLYYKDESINIENNGKNCLAADFASGQVKTIALGCDTSLHYFCIDNQINISLDMQPDPAPWHDAVVACFNMNKALLYNWSLLNEEIVKELDTSSPYWLGIFRRVNTNRNSISFSPQEKKTDILYTLGGTAAGLLLVLILFLLCCILRGSKRKHKAEEHEQVQLNTTPQPDCSNLVVYSVAKSIESPLTENTENPYSLPTIQTNNDIQRRNRDNFQPRLINENPYSLAMSPANVDTEGLHAERSKDDSHKVTDENQYSLSISQIKHDVTKLGSGHTTSMQDTQTINCKNKNKLTSIPENQYHCLNHTLRQSDVGENTTVYDKVKPGVLQIVKGETFIGTEYDSVDIIKKASSNDKQM